jgi:hypothetical protein
MIPAIKGLSNISQIGSDSDVSMTAADSVLGKRSADANEAPGQKLDMSLALNQRGSLGGKQKNGRQARAQSTHDAKKGANGDSVSMRTRRKTASGNVSLGNPARPEEGLRQEQ